MRHYIRLQVTSLVCLSAAVMLTSALLACALTLLRFARISNAPITMRHYIRLQVTSLVCLSAAVMLTSALLACTLTLMFASPLAEMARQIRLPVGLDRDERGSVRGNLLPEDNVYNMAAPSASWTLHQRESTAKTNQSVLIRHPKKNDLDPQQAPWMRQLLPSNVTNSYERPQSRAPQCILLGFAKCGTSALLEFLDLHPNMVTLNWEPDYFCDRMYKKYDLKWYVGRMPPSLPGQITIEKSPCYIVEHDAHLRIHAMNSSIKLLVLVRDPITRLLSEHAHYASYQHYWGLPSQSFEDRFYSNRTGRFKTSVILKVGDYAPHFQHLLKVFPRNQILIVDGDKLITNPLSQISRIESFLGLPHVISRDDIYFDREKSFYCMKEVRSSSPELATLLLAGWVGVSIMGPTKTESCYPRTASVWQQVNLSDVGR
ncbi:hypothetical protein EGW08_013609 [Elysia chlorotica]|uniref:Sulfotransferase domain-containing protein n=1 Tax=Elysia chlorotica TaxID=188477 RepID=A0A3S1HG15_ELYCH|nr:hypothetical protein EGW08_013609 [Elysia chlorotica]